MSLRKRIALLIISFLLGCSLLKKGDKIPPIVEIAVPQDSIWFSGPLPITVFAYDSVGVESVSVFGDNLWLGTDTTEPYEFTWQLQNQSPFSWHTLYAKAYDQAQNEGISSTLHIFYLGRQMINLYHGVKMISPNDYFAIKFGANIFDSLYGEVLVHNQDSLSHFYLLDDNNFSKFKNGLTFTPLLEFSNFGQFATRYHFTMQGEFYLVGQNLTSISKKVWLRFYLTRP
ncbi:MAG: Ig-like domain-containing protein [candidate division WOR-3 bacterium]